MQTKTKRIKHNYTNELELKSIIIRLNNATKNESLTSRTNNDIKNIIKNNKCRRYIELREKIAKFPADNVQHSQRLREFNKSLKSRIIKLSEDTEIDSKTYERFGEIILLMIKHILTKPNFSGYTYSDEFYSDAVFKITKYIHNFDHTKISDKTGVSVNAFAYVSQIIHNAIVYIINVKNKEIEKNRHKVLMETLDEEYNMKYINVHVDNRSQFYPEADILNEETVHIVSITNDNEFPLFSHIVEIVESIDMKILDRLNIIYPLDYTISYDEYNKIAEVMNSKISISRKKENNNE